jgi:Arc/MetJ-type ribon-helix-helix transcriptional regulator
MAENCATRILSLTKKKIPCYDNYILTYHMTTISVPLSHTLEVFIEEMVRREVASNKAEVVRQALVRYAEDKAVEAVLRAEQELSEGKILRGDLRKIAKRLS